MTGKVICPLVASLREHQLLTAAQLEEISRNPLAANPDSKPLATLLVQEGWLTPFQINLLLQGRGKELVLGPFRLLDRLGESSLGRVFKALELPANRIVAIQVIPKEKFPSPDAAARFYAQVQAIQKINHPHLLINFGITPLQDAHVLALEFPEGNDLGQHVQKTGPLPVAIAAKYIRQAALGLQAVHQRGLVHRCIRPASLFLLAPAPGSPLAGTTNAAVGTIKLLDLGLGGLVQPSPEYLAPEQASNPTGADIRADLYSLGCTFYFLLTGRPPFQSNTVSQLLQKQQNEAPPPLTQFRRDVPPVIVAIVGRLLAKRPQDRFQSPAELAAALGVGTGGKRLTGRPIVPMTPPPLPGQAGAGRTAPWLAIAQAMDAGAPRRRRRRSSVPLLVTGLLLLVGGAVAGTLFYPDLMQFRSKPSTVEETPLEVAALPPSTDKEPKVEPKEEPKPKVEPKEEPKPKVEPKEEPKLKVEPKPEPKIDLPDDVPALIKQLKGKDAAVRLNAVKRLEKLGVAAKEAVPALTDALQDADEDVRAVAQRALNTLNKSSISSQKGEIAALGKQLKVKDETTRLQAAKKLGQLGAAAVDAIPALTEALKDADADVRAVAKKSLDAIQVAANTANPAVVEIINGMKGPQQAERVKAAGEVGKLGAEGKVASTALVEAMMERWPTNKEEFLDALGKINPPLHKPVRTLLIDRNFQSRMDALQAIEQLRVEGKPALPVLSLLCQTGQVATGSKGLGFEIRYLAEKSLIVMSRIAPQDKVVIESVVSLIPRNRWLQGGAEIDRTPIELAEEMKVDPKVLVPALLLAATSNQPSRYPAIVALGGLGPEAKSAVPALDMLRVDSDPKVRDAAAAALENIQDK